MKSKEREQELELRRLDEKNGYAQRVAQAQARREYAEWLFREVEAGRIPHITNNPNRGA